MLHSTQTTKKHTGNLILRFGMAGLLAAGLFFPLRIRQQPRQFQVQKIQTPVKLPFTSPITMHRTWNSI